MNDRDLDPAEALALAGRTKAQLADRAVSPWWYAPIYGLGMGALVASQGLPPRLAGLGSAASLLVIIGVYVVWTRKTGLSVHGLRSGRTLWISLALLAFILVVSGLALWLKHSRGYDAAPFAAGAVVAVAAALGSRAWDAAWRAELRGQG